VRDPRWRAGEERRGLGAALAVVLLSNLVSLLLLLPLCRETRVMKTQRDKVSSKQLLFSSNLFCCVSLSLSWATRHQTGSLWRGGMRERPIEIFLGGWRQRPPKRGLFRLLLSFSLFLSLGGISLSAARRRRRGFSTIFTGTRPSPDILSLFSRR